MVPPKHVRVYAEGKALSWLEPVVAAAIVDVMGRLAGWDGEPGCKVDHASRQRLRLSCQAQPDPGLILVRPLAHVVDLHMLRSQPMARSLQIM